MPTTDGKYRTRNQRTPDATPKGPSGVTFRGCRQTQKRRTRPERRERAYKRSEHPRRTMCRPKARNAPQGRRATARATSTNGHPALRG